MLVEDLADQIWANPRFRTDYADLMIESLSDGMGQAAGVRSDGWMDTVRRLLQSATHFAATSNLSYREAAYRIATAAFKLSGDDYETVRDVAVFILARLGNFPAVDLLCGGREKPRYVGLPQALWFETESRELGNVVAIDGRSELLTDFQKRLWDLLDSGESAAVTAPTSAGKSFALQRFLVRLFLHEGGWVVYIVPTRALLNQVADDLADLLNSFGLGHKVFTIPVPPTEMNAQEGIFVLTQERLQLLLEADPKVAFALAIVDEAQILADGGRGVILEVVIEKLKERRPGIQFLFGSPQTKNPAVFQTTFALPKLNVVEEKETPVAQNFIFVDTDPISLDDIGLFIQLDGNRRRVSRMKLPTSLYDANQKLSNISWYIGRGQKSLVYAGGQARCEVIANQLAQLARNQGEQTPVEPDVVEFSKSLREHVHPQFLLADCIMNKIGFHYGNMPPFVRKNVEDLFAAGTLDFLVCTSTLLHGVNLPARNLFLLDPTKGRDWDAGREIPISSTEFWNLAGRAGRLGKEFEGNIFLIDEAGWRSRPLEGERQQDIEPATKKTLKENVHAFTRFLKNSNHPSGKHPAEENTFVKLFIDSQRGALPDRLERILGDSDPAAKEVILAAMTEVGSSISVPRSIVERNVSVSVYRQQEMLDYLVDGIAANGAQRYIPIHPLREWKDANTSLLRVLKRIHSHFEKKPGKDRSEFYFAPLALRWMRGEPLRSLIDGAYKYRQSKQRRVNIATVIRNVFRDVENELRFRYVKYMACYNDLLSEALRRTNNEGLSPHIPSIPLYLELGACSRTMVNLVGLGFSRTAAAVINEVAVEKDMDREATEKFLTEQNWVGLGMSPLLMKEMERVMAGIKSR